MASRNGELLKRLLATFRVEADEHLKAMAAGLLALEQGPAEAGPVVEAVFREAHSLKGAARAVGLAPVESLCQALESVFAALQQGRLAGAPSVLGLLHRALDTLEALLRAPEPAAPPPADLPALIAELEATVWGAPAPAAAVPGEAAPAMMPPPPAVPVSAPASAAPTDTVRVATERLDAVMRQAEELLGPRLAARQRVAEIGEALDAVQVRRQRRQGLQMALRRIERAAADWPDAQRKELQQLLAHLQDESLIMAGLTDRLGRLRQGMARDQHQLDGVSTALLEGIRQMQLRPVASLFEILPRLARDLAREQGKSVAMVLQGAEVELDRRILDALKDPLIHLLRNAIDHGIEPQAVRTAAGKPAQGAVRLAVAPLEGGKIELRLSDDGSGIDVERVKAAACAKGLLSAEQAAQLDEREAMGLVLRSGVTTSAIITDVSGRGLGLAIVQEKVDSLGGSVAIESQRGAGTTFRLVLPLTLATLRGVLVRLGERLFVVPAAGVERVVRIEAAELRTVENRPTLVSEGQVLSLVDLAAVLGLPAVASGAASCVVLVLGQEAVRVAFRVDALLGEQEILLKPLGPQLVRLRHVAGASVLGTGEVVPVLNVAELLRSVLAGQGAPVATDNVEPVARRSLLVAEDSVTSRALLKNILESVGYDVTTAVDGLDALTTLQRGAFDLVVSDVEMPRMDGFELTARIRADPRLAELPVVLVTALDSPADRERGVDVGASAYIVKSRFDQGNLLETVAHLL